MMMIVMLLFLVPIHCSVLFTTIHLMDSSSFSIKAFSSLVLTVTNATSLTLHTVEPDTITGVQGKRLFAAQPQPFYSFQLLHVTRVRSSIEAEDERTASAIIRYSLPHEALLRGMGVMGVDGVELGEADVGWVRWLTTTYLELPPFVAQYLILGWALTVLGFLTCIACYCCCCMRPREVSRVVVIPEASVPTAIVTPAPATLTQRPSAPRPPPIAPAAAIVPPAVATQVPAVNGNAVKAKTVPITTPPVPPKPEPPPKIPVAGSQAHEVAMNRLRNFLQKQRSMKNLPVPP